MLFFVFLFLFLIIILIINNESKKILKKENGFYLKSKPIEQIPEKIPLITMIYY